MPAAAIAPRTAQRGRAMISFQAGVAQSVNRLRVEAEQELLAAGLTEEALPDDIDARHAVIDAALAGSDAFTVRHLLAEWRAKAHGPVCAAAFEEVRAEVEPQLRALDEGPATLEADPDLVPPSYYSKVWFHRTAGGWDASEDNGYIHGELIHKLLLSKIFPGDIFGQRKRAAEEAPRRDYGRILDMGASSGHATLATAAVFPDAEMYGVDLSYRMLQHARRTANSRGLAWKLSVQAAEATRFEDGFFGLVTSYNLLHELPPRAINAVFAESFRVLEPGGDMLMVDVPRYFEMDRMASWRYDLVARWGGEPYWRASASMDLKAAAEAAGFVDVRAYGLGLAPNGHPYVVSGRKPAAA